MDYGFLWYVIVAVLLLEWGWDQALEGLNRKSWAAHVPERLKDVFPEDKFQKQKDYRRVNHSFSLINSVTSLLLILVVLFLHGFGWLDARDRKSTRLNSSHVRISYAVFCLKKKKKKN